MWKCRKCGEVLEDTLDTCWRCGTPDDGAALRLPIEPYTPPPLGPDLTQTRHPGIRLCVAVLFLLAIQAGPPYGYDHLGATSVWNRFWLGLCGASALVVLVPVFFYGQVWHKIVASVVMIFSALGLYESLSYLLFDLLR